MSLPLPTFTFSATTARDRDFCSHNWINCDGSKVNLRRRSNNFVIEAEALRAAPESCLIYVNRDQSVVQHSFRVQLSLSFPSREVVDEYTRAHSRIGFVVEQAGQRFFTKPYAWPHRTNTFRDPKLSIICDSCQTTSAWRSRPGLSLQSNESPSTSSSFVFELGTPLHFGCYICYWPNSTAAAAAVVPAQTPSSSPMLLKFGFDLSIEELQIDGWNIVMEDRFDDRSRWLNCKGERLDRDYNLRSDTPQQFEISAHCLASTEGAALIYINQDDQVLLGEQASRLQMIFSGWLPIQFKDELRIGFVVQQGSSSKGSSAKWFFSKETFPWPCGIMGGQAQHLVNQHTTWLSALDSNEEEIGSSVVLGESNEPLFFGFYIQLHPDTIDTWKAKYRPKRIDIKFEVTWFKVVAEYVDHGLEQSITHSGIFLRSRLVPGLTRFIRKSGQTTENRVFLGLSLDGEILVSHDDDDGNNGLMMTLPAAGGGSDEKWKVEQSTYPPCAFYDADAFVDKPELLSKIFGKRKPRHVYSYKTFAGKRPSVKLMLYAQEEIKKFCISSLLSSLKFFVFLFLL